MISLEDVKALYAFGCAILCLTIISPFIATLMPIQGRPIPFSELWVLDTSSGMEGYPFNVTMNVANKVHVGVGNHMGSLAYYLVYVKFRNQTEPLPNATSGIPSPLTPVFEYLFFLPDNEKWETLMTFSFLEATEVDNRCRIDSMMINDQVFAVGKNLVWNSLNNGFFCQLFFELWFYNTTNLHFEYHNRFVGFWMNMTS